MTETTNLVRRVERYAGIGINAVSVLSPAGQVASVVAGVVALPFAAVAALAWGSVVLIRGLIRPMLYVLAAAALLAIGGGGGYVFCLYQSQGLAAHAMRAADADDQGPAPPQTQISPPPAPTQAEPVHPFGPKLPAPQTDPFGLKTTR